VHELEVEVKFRIKSIYKCDKKCTKSRVKRLRPALVHRIHLRRPHPRLTRAITTMSREQPFKQYEIKNVVQSAGVFALCDEPCICVLYACR